MLALAQVWPDPYRMSRALPPSGQARHKLTCDQLYAMSGGKRVSARALFPCTAAEYSRQPCLLQQSSMSRIIIVGKYEENMIHGNHGNTDTLSPNTLYNVTTAQYNTIHNECNISSPMEEEVSQQGRPYLHFRVGSGAESPSSANEIPTTRAVLQNSNLQLV